MRIRSKRLAGILREEGLTRKQAADKYVEFKIKPLSQRDSTRFPEHLARFLINKVGEENAGKCRELDWFDNGPAVLTYGEGLSWDARDFLRMTGLSLDSDRKAIASAQQLMEFPGMPKLGVYREEGYTWNFGRQQRGRQTGWRQIWPKAEPLPEAGETYKIRRGRVTVSVGPQQVFVQGATYSIKEDLKSMGFRWDGGRKAWWLPANRYDRATMATLRGL